MADTKYYSKDNFSLLHGDTLKILPTLPSESFDLIFADPPYFLGKDEWDESRGVDLDYEFHTKWLSECKKLLKPNGTIWVSGTYHSIYQCGFALQKLGFHILNDIAWLKPRSPRVTSHRNITPTHETLIWASKSKDAKHTYNYEYMKHATLKDDFLKLEGEELKSVWAINAPGGLEKLQGEHSTQKPTQLLKRIILSCTKPGDSILDPFCGSGTTGIVSHLYGRKFTGIDQEKKYLDVATRRFCALATNMQRRLKSANAVE
ncbi:MAG: site-specific DNA-methyltransferase [bacterium]|nr:site-specific DNA-methyltransferase [bacterium]